MRDHHPLRHVERGNSAVVAVVERILLSRGIVGQDSQRVGDIVNRLRVGIGHAEGVAAAEPSFDE